MPTDKIIGLSEKAFSDVSEVVLWYFQSGLDRRLGGSFRKRLQDALDSGGADYFGPFALSIEDLDVVVKTGYVHIGTGSFEVEEAHITITIADEGPWYIYLETKWNGTAWANTLLSSQSRPNQSDDEDGRPTQRIILGLVNVVYDAETPANSYLEDPEQWWQAGDIFVYDRLVT